MLQNERSRHGSTGAGAASRIVDLEKEVAAVRDEGNEYKRKSEHEIITLREQVCGVWCVVCGVWCVVCGVWCVVCGVWCVVCGVWCVLCEQEEVSRP
jgi:hypothetical protein